MYQIRRRKIFTSSGGATIDTVAAPGIENLELVSGEIDLTVNERGSFVFKIAPTHTYHGQFKKLEDILEVRLNNESTVRPAHYFRVMDIHRDFIGNEIITCEGLLGLLGDCLALPYFADVENNMLIKGGFDERTTESTLTLAKIIRYVLATSVNAQLSISSTSAISVTEPESTEGLARSSDGSNTVLAEMLDIIDHFGGYLYIYSVTFTANNLEVYFGYRSTSPPGKTCTQTIEFGKNLLDLQVRENAADLYTSCLAVGDVVQEGITPREWGNEGRRTARNSINGSIYIDAPTYYMYHYGRRVIFKQFDGLTTAEEVRCAGESYIRQLIKQSVTIEIKAVDLKAVDSTQDGFTAGDAVHIISSPHNIDDTYLCSQAHIDLCDLSKSYYVFGASYKRISSMLK